MRKFIIFLAVFSLILTGIFYFRYQVYYSHGSFQDKKIIEIAKGDGNAEIASRLTEEGIISGKIYFYYYLRSHDLINKIFPGEYELSGRMTIPEIATEITSKHDDSIKVTFPEGWDSKKIAIRLKENNLPGDDFLKLVDQPDKFRAKYNFLQDNKITTLEGYLFPDTYFFKKDVTAEGIVDRMLATFQDKVMLKISSDLSVQNKNLRETIIMASIVEREVAKEADMPIVAGIFSNRLANNMLLQSDAPLSFIFQDNEDQHSGKDLEIDSPYNTYKYKGLPPGPICNPGFKAILAAITPQKTDYNFFLTVTAENSKKTIFSKTFEEHVANRQKYGI